MIQKSSFNAVCSGASGVICNPIADSASFEVRAEITATAKYCDSDFAK